MRMQSSVEPRAGRARAATASEALSKALACGLSGGAAQGTHQRRSSDVAPYYHERANARRCLENHQAGTFRVPEVKMASTHLLCNVQSCRRLHQTRCSCSRFA